MRKTLRFLGIDGRTTIPLAIRYALGLQAGDIISFELNGDQIVLQKEKLCDGCSEFEESLELTDFLDLLTAKERHEALLYLTRLNLRKGAKNHDY